LSIKIQIPKKMTNIEIRQLGFEDILNRLEQLDKPALLKFADFVNGLISQKNQGGQREAQLLRKIKTHIPATMKRRQKELYAKMQNNALSLPERDELILLNAMIEEKTAERIILMGELAQLRHISIEQLNHQLNPELSYAQA
jgi:hypothetical protein